MTGEINKEIAYIIPPQTHRGIGPSLESNKNGKCQNTLTLLQNDILEESRSWREPGALSHVISSQIEIQYETRWSMDPFHVPKLQPRPLLI